MKQLKRIIAIILLTAFLGSPIVGVAADKEKAPKPYPLKTCLVSDEKLGEMGDPYVLTHEGRELKLCCKGCLKDFKKDPAKYVKKLEQSEAKAKKKSQANPL
jgi:YHS domain-containing protein